jgi:hypothetical protein
MNSDIQWGKVLGKRPLLRKRKKLEDNIKTCLREIGCNDAKWVELAQDRVQ